MTGKLLQFLVSRVSSITILILLQFGFIAGMVYYLSDSFFIIYTLLTIISVAVVVWIVSKSDNPSYKMTWVILILIMPIFGGLFYIVWGNKQLPPSLSDKIKYYKSLPPVKSGADKNLLPRLWEQDPQLAVQARYILSMTGSELWENTSAKFYALGDDGFPDMIEALKSAEKFILMEFYIINFGVMWDSILEILKEKARNGVKVMLMYDDFGTIHYLPRHYDRYLRSLGIETAVFNPYRPHLNMSMNYRDHRKIVVIDGNIGFCGGFNISDEYINRHERFGHWKDTGVRISGDAVWNLSYMFLTLWRFTTNSQEINFDDYRPTKSFESDGLVQPFDDDPMDHKFVVKDNYLGMINRATNYLYLSTPYLILDDEMIRALTRAAQCGVDVRIITPHIPDKWYVHIISQAHYERLLAHGVRVYEYLPGFIHAKQIVADDKIAVVGTTNMDFRSFYLNYECGVAFYNSSICKTVKMDFMDTICKSIEITEDSLSKTPFYNRIFAAVLKVFEPLL